MRQIKLGKDDVVEILESTYNSTMVMKPFPHTVTGAEFLHGGQACSERQPVRADKPARPKQFFAARQC
jgi:hypothetical protein